MTSRAPANTATDAVDSVLCLDLFVDPVPSSCSLVPQEAGVSVAYLLSKEFLELSQSRSGKDDPNFYDLKVRVGFRTRTLKWLADYSL